jgi:hypothetical protein
MSIKLALVVLAVGGVMAFPATSRADTKSCVAAHASGQREAKVGHFKQAVTLYTSCGADLSCPEQLRAECTELMEGARRLIPSVMFSVIDRQGADTSAVKVYHDDALLVDGLDGRAVELDPGKYHLRFVLSDGSTLTTDVVIREGEKNRLVEVRAEPEAKPELKPLPPPAPVVAPAAPVVKSGPPVAAWVLTGTAVVGLGTFGTFALLGRKDKQQLDDCAPTCPSSASDKRDQLKTKFLIADIGLGVGAASAVVAGVLFITSGGSSNADSAKRRPVGLDVASGREGAELLWRGEF